MLLSALSMTLIPEPLALSSTSSTSNDTSKPKRFAMILCRLLSAMKILVFVKTFTPVPNSHWNSAYPPFTIKQTYICNKLSNTIVLWHNKSTSSQLIFLIIYLIIFLSLLGKLLTIQHDEVSTGHPFFLSLEYQEAIGRFGGDGHCYHFRNSVISVREQ